MKWCFNRREGGDRRTDPPALELRGAGGGDVIRRMLGVGRWLRFSAFA